MSKFVNLDIFHHQLTCFRLRDGRFGHLHYLCRRIVVYEEKDL